MNHWAISDEYTQMMLEVINVTPELEFLKNADVRIICLACQKKKKSGRKVTHAECRKVPEIEKVFNPYDYEIVLYEPNNAYMSDRQIRILLEHELLHVELDEVDGEIKYKTRGHDYDDFKSIIQKYGVDWADEKPIKDGGWFSIEKTEPAAGELVEVRGDVRGTTITDHAIWTGNSWQYLDETEAKAPETWPEWRFCVRDPAETEEMSEETEEEKSA